MKYFVRKTFIFQQTNKLTNKHNKYYFYINFQHNKTLSNEKDHIKSFMLMPCK